MKYPLFSEMESFVSSKNHFSRRLKGVHTSLTKILRFLECGSTIHEVSTDLRGSSEHFQRPVRRRENQPNTTTECDGENVGSTMRGDKIELDVPPPFPFPGLLPLSLYFEQKGVCACDKNAPRRFLFCWGFRELENGRWTTGWCFFF